MNASDEHEYIVEGFRNLRADFAAKNSEADPEVDAARAAEMIAAGDVRLIEEYLANGIVPIKMANGRPVSLYLARMLGLHLESLFADEEAA
ncbi:hypothetical protein [Tardiphaga sp. 709]|uniref:hypothetical protein n=1 Tax=Tardiphaga sp. 709 TaxID=3076039 RepID=UPI0028E95B91|nr:hypothetical protein [Tardiphaga sp. 709]WNV09972.1 hypothetical protein RSO67_01885 [Tardiphaga sp. 709]